MGAEITFVAKDKPIRSLIRGRSCYQMKFDYGEINDTLSIRAQVQQSRYSLTENVEQLNQRAAPVEPSLRLNYQKQVLVFPLIRHDRCLLNIVSTLRQRQPQELTFGTRSGWINALEQRAYLTPVIVQLHVRIKEKSLKLTFTALSFGLII